MEVAAVTLHLHHICGQLLLILQLILITGSALPDVVDKVELLQVLVCLAVQLEIGLEIRLVIAQPAYIVVIVNNHYFGRGAGGLPRSVYEQMLVKIVQVVRTEAVAD